MPDNFMPSAVDYIRVLPEIVLTIAGTLIMLLEALLKESQKKIFAPFAALSLIVAGAGAIYANGSPGLSFNDMIVVDSFATFFRVLVITVGVLVVFCASDYLHREHAPGGEFYALILFSIMGQCVMSASNELITIFIGLEISSIASYILAAYLRDDRRNNEAGLKYFLLGSFATAFLLYGVAWIYGITGTTNLLEIRRALSMPGAPSVTLTAAAAALMFVGFGFKISVVPFQIWAPDVYQGAPAPVAGFLTVGPKAAAFAILLRTYLVAFMPIEQRWMPFLWACALATMIVGNFAAIQQTNIKRLLAYSSIAHAGYVLVAVTAHSGIGASAAMFYLAAYAFTNFGAFAVVSYVSNKGEKHTSINDFAGLAQRQPMMAAMLTIFLLSLIGVPLTGGFFGKFYIFKAALDANLVWLTVLGLLNSAVAAYYYLRVLVVMYMKDPEKGAEPLPAAGPAMQIAVIASAVGTLVLGIFPSFVLDFATKALGID